MSSRTFADALLSIAGGNDLINPSEINIPASANRFEDVASAAGIETPSSATGSNTTARSGDTGFLISDTSRIIPAFAASFIATNHFQESHVTSSSKVTSHFVTASLNCLLFFEIGYSTTYLDLCAEFSRKHVACKIEEFKNAEVTGLARFAIPNDRVSGAEYGAFTDAHARAVAIFINEVNGNQNAATPFGIRLIKTIKGALNRLHVALDSRLIPQLFAEMARYVEEMATEPQPFNALIFLPVIDKSVSTMLGKLRASGIVACTPSSSVVAKMQEWIPNIKENGGWSGYHVILFYDLTGSMRQDAREKLRKELEENYEKMTDDLFEMCGVLVEQKKMG